MCDSGATLSKVGPGGSCALAEASRVGNVKVVQSLVQQGAELEVANPEYNGATPLAVAVMNKYEPVVEFLIKVASLLCRSFFVMEVRSKNFSLDLNVKVKIAQRDFSCNNRSLGKRGEEGMKKRYMTMCNFERRM